MPLARKRDPEADAVVSALGERLRFRRKQCGLSQVGLAELSGVDPSAIPRIEKGTRGTDLANLLALARVLGCPAGWLVFGEGALPPPPVFDAAYQDQRRRS